MLESLTLETAAPARRDAAVGEALVWDSTNTSAVVIARGLRRLGWRVHWLGTPVSPWRNCSAFNGEHFLVQGLNDERLATVFAAREFDAVFLHGDDQVRWILEHWNAVPERVRAGLSAPDALRTALSKEQTAKLATSLGVPVLPTLRCSSPAEVAAAAQTLAPNGGQIVLKGEGGAAGCTVGAVTAGRAPDHDTWARVTRFSPVALVQRRIAGPRVFASVVYEHGVERAACIHEKIATFPYDFGPTAFGVTRHVDAVHDDLQRMFGALRWHGIANAEFRQDSSDGRWYFMEINPRVNASAGIQEAAGMDIAATWAAVCHGVRPARWPGREYRDGVRFAWGVRGIALALQRPWSVPAWGLRSMLDGGSDLAYLDPALRWRAARLGLWMARQNRFRRH